MTNQTVPYQGTSTSNSQGRSRAHGKWQQPGVPHKGWSCDAVIDLGDERMTCEMCESAEIRYVHRMSHPEYPSSFGVGFVCAENMAQAYQTPNAIGSHREVDTSDEILADFIHRGPGSGARQEES